MRDDAYLAHILEAIAAIESYTRDGREDFLTDRKTQDAVVRNLEIIGEAVKGLSESFRSAHSELPLRQLAGMRDRLIHQYFGIDLELLWAVVEKRLPELRRSIEQIQRR